MRSNEIVHRLRAAAKTHGLSKTSIAKLAGIGDTTLRDFWRSNWNPTLDVLQKVEDAVERIEKSNT
tara:strand:+ start:764 stop:961 length:198 start_codon:yes stop_codon:yes gene_type:complete